MLLDERLRRHIGEGPGRREGITAASLYNAFGDKRAIHQKALDPYVEGGIADRIRRCEELPPLAGIEAFFEEIVRRPLRDRDRKRCMLVNAATRCCSA